MTRLTIYDIAEKAGVSPATVSRVMNNSQAVRPQTRERVEKVLKEFDYTPDETARGLAKQSTKLIGVLITDIRVTQHTDGIYYLQHEFLKHGYACVVFNTGLDIKDQVETIKLVYNRKMDAAILMGSVFQREEIKEALATYLSDIPVAICNGYVDLPNVIGVISDEHTGVYEAVELLAKSGKTKIAFLVNTLTVSNALKEKGYREGVRDFCPGEEPVVEKTGETLEEIYKTTQRLIAERPDINGLIFAEDFLAVTGINALTQAGHSVPEEISVIGINNSEYARLSRPRLTSLDNMMSDVSLTVARNIITALNGEHVNKKTFIATEVFERETT